MGENLKIRNKKLVAVPFDSLVSSVVRLMKEKNVSSVLVHRDQQLAGIITERDIVRNFALLPDDLRGKATAGSLMQRPVVTVSLNSIVADVRRLREQHGYRHFPISRTGDLSMAGIVGMLTATDFLDEYYLMIDRAQKSEKDLIGLVAEDGALCGEYVALLSALGYEVVNLSNWSFSEADWSSSPVLVDMDGMTVEKIKTIILALKKQKAPTLLLSSDASLVSLLEEKVSSEFVHFAEKPFDMQEILQFVRKPLLTV